MTRTRGRFQSTRPVRGATVLRRLYGSPIKISIHAPRAGRDLTATESLDGQTNFNPRAPCGARPVPCMVFFVPLIFQSTRPVRGATETVNRNRELQGKFQSTRPVRGATVISILLESMLLFQSTRPVRGATQYFCRLPAHLQDFNPRAPCGARLSCLNTSARHNTHFNPRAPCGARQVLPTHWVQILTFQSTRPVRGATLHT